MNELLQDEIAQWILIVGIMLVAIALRMWLRRRTTARNGRNRTGCNCCDGCSRCPQNVKDK